MKPTWAVYINGVEKAGTRSTNLEFVKARVFNLTAYYRQAYIGSYHIQLRAIKSLARPLEGARRGVKP